MNAKTQTRTANRPKTSSAVRFELFHRVAKRVCVAGSFNNWNPSATPLAPAGNGRWLRELWLPPGEYEYLFLVDGEWLFDPRAADYVPNVFGGMNAVIHVQQPRKRPARTAKASAPSLAPHGANKSQLSATYVACAG